MRRASVPVLLVGWLSLLWVAGAAAATSLPGTAARTFALEMDVALTPEAGAEQVRLWVPLPTRNEVQEVHDLAVESPLPYRLSTAPPGNRLVYLESEGEPIRLKVRARVRRREQVGAVPAREPVERWLQAERLVPRGEPFRSLARTTVAGLNDPLARARALYDYVTSTVEYDKSGEGWGRGDARYACDARRGNCTDFHSLLIALSREAGLPARFLIGYPIPPRGQGEVKGYHCWAELYIEGQGWFPVDSSEASKNPDRWDYYFGSLDPDRVLFTVGRDLVLDPPQEGPPLNYWVRPYAEVDGREVEAEFHLRYASL